MNGKGNQRTPFWKSLSKLDWMALAVVFLGIWAGWSGNPLQGDAAMRFLRFLALLALVYLAYRARQIIYAQLGSYILHEEIHRRVDLLADSAAHIAAAEETLPASIDQKTLEQSLAAQLEVAEGKTLPGLVVSFHVREDYLQIRRA